MLVPHEVLMSQGFADIPLPKAWPERARSAIIHVVSLAHSAIVCARGWAVNSPIARVRLRGQLEVARAEIALLTEELRIKGGQIGIHRFGDGLRELELTFEKAPLAFRGSSGCIMISNAHVAEFERVVELGVTLIVRP